MKPACIFSTLALIVMLTGCGSRSDEAVSDMPAATQTEAAEDVGLDTADEALLDEVEAEPLQENEPVTRENYKEALDSLETEVEQEQ